MNAKTRIQPVIMTVSRIEDGPGATRTHDLPVISRVQEPLSENACKIPGENSGEYSSGNIPEKKSRNEDLTSRVFSLKDIDDYIENALSGRRPKTIQENISAWKQFLGFGEVLHKKVGNRGKIVGLEAKISFDTITAYNNHMNTLKKSPYPGYIRSILQYFSKKRVDDALRDWSESVKQTPNTTKRLFAVEGDKAAVTFNDVKADIRIYYNHILRDDLGKGVSSKKSTYRNLVNILFGITTGARVEEMNRLTWTELDQGLEGGSFIVPAEYTKTNAERVIPIHPAIKPYLKILKAIYPDKPFNIEKFRDIRRDRDATLRLNQTRNFAVKYWRKYGIDEKIRIAIMGHDEGVIKKEIEQEEVKTDVSDVYRKYGPAEITDHYQKTVGAKFNPIPTEINIKKIKENLKQFFKN